MAFKFPNQETNKDFEDATEFCKKSIQDVMDLRRETTALYKYFTEQIGEIVDLNLDYFPEMIVVTFLQNQVVQEAIKKKTYVYEKQTDVASHTNWTFEASKVNFTLTVRNCIPDELPPNKYLPIFANK